jgi:hypothetical protein
MQLSNRINQLDKSNLETSSWTTQPETLLATYVDLENTFWYIISEQPNGKKVIRKMSIQRDINYARSINIKAKELIGKQVIFGVTQGWSNQVWFNDIEQAL